jgi:hypothetical protein
MVFVAGLAEVMTSAAGCGVGVIVGVVEEMLFVGCCVLFVWKMLILSLMEFCGGKDFRKSVELSSSISARVLGRGRYV